MILTIPGKNIHSVDDFYTFIETALDLEEFGRNLDALYDVLTDSDIETIIFEDVDTLKGMLGKTYTLSYYKERLLISINNYEKEFLKQSISELEKGRGVTLFERIVEVLQEIDSIEVEYQ